MRYSTYIFVSSYLSNTCFRLEIDPQALTLTSQCLKDLSHVELLESGHSEPGSIGLQKDSSRDIFRLTNEGANQADIIYPEAIKILTLMIGALRDGGEELSDTTIPSLVFDDQTGYAHSVREPQCRGLTFELARRSYLLCP